MVDQIGLRCFLTLNRVPSDCLVACYLDKSYGSTENLIRSDGLNDKGDEEIKFVL